MKKIIVIVLGVVLAAFLSFRKPALSGEQHVNGKAENAIVFLHGYTQSGRRMQEISEHIKGLFPNTVFYFPNGPERAPFGEYQWFGVPLLSIESIDEKSYAGMMSGAMDNVELILDLIDDIHAKQKISYEKISVVGFSQGAMMAVLTGLMSEKPLKKVVSLSGIPVLFTPDFQRGMIKNKPQVLLIQGTDDRVIPPESLYLTSQTLNEAEIKYKADEIRGMGHMINEEVMNKTSDFIRN